MILTSLIKMLCDQKSGACISTCMLNETKRRKCDQKTWLAFWRVREMRYLISKRNKEVSTGKFRYLYLTSIAIVVKFVQKLQKVRPVRHIF